MPARSRVSVVVCTHNGAEQLPNVLAALARQEIPCGAIEVLVVADHCSDDTVAVAERARVRIVEVTDGAGLAAARNTGIKHSSGEIIAFTDDDCEPAVDWVSQIVAAFDEEPADGVGGRTVPAATHGASLGYVAARNPLAPLPTVLLKSGPLVRLWHYVRTGQGPSVELAAGSELYSVTGANMAFRRQVLEDVGGFDLRFTFGSEEEDLCRRVHLRRRGARFVYWPNAVVRHHYRDGTGDILRRARAYGRGNARSASAHSKVLPIIFPFPLLWLGTLLLSRQRIRRLLATTLLPWLLYFRWPLHALRTRERRALAYPYIQLAQESATMLGEVEFWVQRRRLESRAP